MLLGEGEWGNLGCMMTGWWWQADIGMLCSWAKDLREKLSSHYVNLEIVLDRKHEDAFEE